MDTKQGAYALVRIGFVAVEEVVARRGSCRLVDTDILLSYSMRYSIWQYTEKIGVAPHFPYLVGRSLN